MVKPLLLAAALLTALPTTALAAGPSRCDVRTLEGCKSRLYDFRDQVFDGGVRQPKVKLFVTRADVRHARMLKLAKDLLPEIGKSRHDRSLR